MPSTELEVIIRPDGYAVIVAGRLKWVEMLTDSEVDTVLDPDRIKYGD